MVPTGERRPNDPEELLGLWQDAYGDLPDTPSHVEDWTVAEFAAVRARNEAHLDSEDMRQELLDRLRIAMINAVVDVPTVLDLADLDMSPATLRTSIEGGRPMTLGEYARVRCAIPRGEP